MFSINSLKLTLYRSYYTPPPFRPLQHPLPIIFSGRNNINLTFFNVSTMNLFHENWVIISRDNQWTVKLTNNKKQSSKVGLVRGSIDSVTCCILICNLYLFPNKSELNEKFKKKNHTIVLYWFGSNSDRAKTTGLPSYELLLLLIATEQYECCRHVSNFLRKIRDRAVRRTRALVWSIPFFVLTIWCLTWLMSIKCDSYNLTLVQVWSEYTHSK